MPQILSCQIHCKQRFLSLIVIPTNHPIGIFHKRTWIKQFQPLPERTRPQSRGFSSSQGLGAAEAGIAALEQRLQATPFQAPEAEDLAALRLGPRELAAAERLGRVLRLPDGVVLLPTAPALAMRELAGLSQPFTTSQARQALGTTRRVAIPLLEHLDGRGWTRRVDAGHREIVR